MTWSAPRSASAPHPTAPQAAGRDQAPDQDRPHRHTAEETCEPITVIGRDRVSLIVGTGSSTRAVIASIATGQPIKQLSIENLSPIVNNPSAMAGSPDGKTLYYVEAHVVWATSTDGTGTRSRIREGDGIAVDPHGQYLVVEVDDTARVRLFRVPPQGGRARRSSSGAVFA